MPPDTSLPFWLLAFSYWLHLLATVVWLGGLTTMAFVAWPALRGRLLEPAGWAELQRRFTPLANLSLVILLVTGFVQMTGDSNYEGFLQSSSLWSQAILAKHIAVLLMIGVGAVMQWRIQPALARLALLAEKRPEMAAAEREKIGRQEVRLLRLNLLGAALVLLFTAIATAI